MLVKRRKAIIILHLTLVIVFTVLPLFLNTGLALAEGDSRDVMEYNVPTGERNSSAFTNNLLTVPDEGESWISKNAASLVVSLVNGIIKILGLHPIDELALNTTYLFWGALDTNDVHIVSSVIIPLTGVAWLIAGISMQFFGIQLAHSTMNARRRAKIYEFFEGWFVGAILLTAGPRLLNLVFQASSTLVVAFLKSPLMLSTSGRLSNGFDPIYIAQSAPHGPGTAVAVALFALATVGITLALNFLYLQRYVMLFIYSALSPIFFATYFFEKTRSVFWNYFKEVLALALTPAVHALMIYLYMAIAHNTADNTLLRLVFLIMFIPISEMIRKFLGVAGGTGGLGQNFLTGIGMGTALAGARALGGLASAVAGGGAVNNAVSTLMSGGKQVGAGGAAVQTVAGMFSGGNANLSKAQALVNHAKNIGKHMGGLAGAVGGAVMGASTGNMGMLALGGLGGYSVGEKMGGAAAQRAAGNVTGQILGHGVGEAAKGAWDAMPGGDLVGAVKAGVGQLAENVKSTVPFSESRQEMKDKLFGADQTMPANPVFQGQRGNIANANIAALKGQTHKANRISADIAKSMQSAVVSPGSVTPQQGDIAYARAFPNRTEFYYQQQGQDPVLMDISSEGDKRAGYDTPVESVMELATRRGSAGNSASDFEWKEIGRRVMPLNSQNQTGLPTWNTGASIFGES